MKTNIALIGFMGTGKSAVGKELARNLQKKFFDTDQFIEEQTGRTITTIFAEQGEAYFRVVESKVVQQLAQKTEVVISTGGGAALAEANIQALLETCFVVCLQATPATIYDRTSGQKVRPLLAGDNPLTKIELLLASRKSAYDKAELKIATDKHSVQQIAALICAAYRRSGEHERF